MKLIEQSSEILSITPDPLRLIEKAGRTCWKSEEKIHWCNERDDCPMPRDHCRNCTNRDSAIGFVEMLRKVGHESVLEHGVMTVRFVTNRSVTHELVRHRLASFSQESTRYVKYDGEMEFIRPIWFNGLHEFDKNIETWKSAMMIAENHYKYLIAGGWRPEQAREVLPNALKTEIVVTANFREWMHIFKLRCSPKAHPQIRALMIDCREQARKLVPVIFEED